MLEDVRVLVVVLVCCFFGACASAPEPVSVVAPVSEPVSAPVQDCFNRASPPLVEVFTVWQLLSLHELAMGEGSLREASGDPVGVLMFLHAHPEIKPITRQRALEAMSFVPDERVRALYEGILKEGEGDPLRHKVITGYARAWPRDAPLMLGSLLMLDTDVQIRLTAASALGRFCGEEGRALVLQAVEGEKEDWAREKMKRYSKPLMTPAVPGLMPGGLPQKVQ